MARIRTIKPEFFTSADIVSRSPMARLLYIALWCEADKEGRLVWKPTTFKLRYLPGDNCDVDALCAELVESGLVRLYGDGYAVIPSFKAHQHVNPRESESQLPAPTEKLTRQARDGTRQARDSDAQGGREGKGREGKESPKPPAGAKSSTIEFKTFIAKCKAENEKPISDYKPLFDYTDRVSLPAEFVQLAWFEFGRIFGDGGVKESRRQKDWRKTFRNYVEKGYLKLWWLNGETFELTTAGKQAQRANAERLAA